MIEWHDKPDGLPLPLEDLRLVCSTTITSLMSPYEVTVVSLYITTPECLQESIGRLGPNMLPPLILVVVSAPDKNRDDVSVRWTNLAKLSLDKVRTELLDDTIDKEWKRL